MAEVHKLVLFFDGTWNTSDFPEKFSNVKKLKDLTVEKYTEDDITYITDVHYLAGPGTRQRDGLWGGAFAGDLAKIIEEAYIWLIQKYIDYKKTGFDSEIYIFGFSRGAYLAHIMSWFLNDFGFYDNYETIPHAIKSFIGKNKQELKEIKLIDSSFKTLPAKIKMLGLWDMVSAPLDVFSGYNDGAVAPIVENIYHAMALDERRVNFGILKYSDHNLNIQQRWFSGVHSDIGGGYEDSTLSNITLNWMIDMAVEEDLMIKNIAVIDDENFINMKKHDEAGLITNNRKYKNEEIDDSVYRRMKVDSSYKPCAVDFSKMIR